MKTKAQLKREIKAAKNDYQIAEIYHGFNSPQRLAAIKTFWQLQSELGAIEIAELEHSIKLRSMEIEAANK